VKHPGLWSYAVLPVVLNLLISALAFAVLLLAVVGFVTRLHPLFPPGWGWLLLEVLAGMAILLVAVLAAIVVWFVLQGVLCGHFFGKLAREVELQLGTPPEALKELPFWWQLADTLRDLAALILAHIGLLLLHVVPVLGSMASLAGSAYCDCYLFGREYLDLPLSLRGRTRRQRQAFARQFRGQTLGLGAAVLLMSAAPVIGPVLLTTAVVGAVLLHQRLASGKSQLPVGHA
jgi:CysZ protein